MNRIKVLRIDGQTVHCDVIGKEPMVFEMDEMIKYGFPRDLKVGATYEAWTDRDGRELIGGWREYDPETDAAFDRALGLKVEAE